MFKKVLVGYDGSDVADRAFELAVRLVDERAGALLVLAVARPAEPAAEVEEEALLESAQRYYVSGNELLPLSKDGSTGPGFIGAPPPGNCFLPGPMRSASRP